MAQGTCELLWLWSLLNELDFPIVGSSTLSCDNKSAIMLSSDSVLHKRTNHVEVDIHFIWEKVRSGVLVLSFVRSSNQTTDVFTKSVGPTLIQSSLGKLGLVNVFTPTWGGALEFGNNYGIWYRFDLVHVDHNYYDFILLLFLLFCFLLWWFF